MFDNVSDRRKIIAINHLAVVNTDGTINITATIESFKDILEVETKKINDFATVMLPVVQDILSKSSTDFVSTDNLKFLVRSKLERTGVTTSGEEVADWINNAVSKGLLYCRQSRRGGIQLWDNAKHIIARSRSFSKGKKVTDEVIASAEEHMRAEHAKQNP